MEIPAKSISIHGDYFRPAVSQSKENVQNEGSEDEYDTHGDSDWEIDMASETTLDSAYSEFEKELATETQPSKEGINELHRSTAGLSDVPMHKYPFKLKQNEEGNILTVHNTIKSVDKDVRIRIAAYCFNEMSNKLVVIDRRGNIYIFDFVCKRYWRLGFKVPEATLLVASPLVHSEYIVGTESGCVFIFNIEKTPMLHTKVGDAAINEVSFGNRLDSNTACNTLIRLGATAVLLNFTTLQLSHRLEFDHSKYTLKFASFLPKSDKFFTCFTNDSVHLWSSSNLGTVYISQPIKARDRTIRLMRGDTSKIPEIVLRAEYDEEEDNLNDELAFKYDEQHFSDGKLLAYSFSPNGNKLLLSTVDGYLMMLNTASLDLEKLFKLRDFILKQFVLLAQPKNRILFAITATGMAVMLDLLQTEYKLIVQRSNALSLNVSRDGKLLSLLSKSGEVNVWSTCRLYNSLHAQTKCISKVRAALKQPAAKLPGLISGPLNLELRKLLKRERLEAMLAEYGFYPEKYRFIIWSVLLELPSNTAQFQALLKHGQPQVVKQRAAKIKVKSDAQRRAVIKVWSCLAHWCKVFGHTDFMPDLIYPFVKQMTKNSLVVFELLVTLLLNHMELCFEFHPMPPGNYLGLCENVLQVHDKQLSKFYAAMDVQPKDYAWSLLTNGFAEVLDEQQWLVLWDNIVTNPPYFIVFVIVAYNMMQREIIMRLPEKSEVVDFFHEQMPIDVTKWLNRARKLMSNCVTEVHPERFMPPFKPIPKGVYPKFLKYPREWIEQQEQLSDELIKQQQEIDARLRKLELEEIQMKERLQEGLKQEEHARRIKEMEQLYQDTIHREEERIACHRKMLLTYQMEARQRKCEVLSKLQETEQRRKILEMEKDIDGLMRSVERERRRQNQEMLFAEDEIRNQEMELMAQRYSSCLLDSPLTVKYYEEVEKMRNESDKLKKQLREMTMEQVQSSTEQASTPSKLKAIEYSIHEIQQELTDILNSESNSQ
ncbi:TBC1 domain family member 31 isoform X1 [Drosophila mojavensis]|uniref:Rab-GAP TBC domain-containing protein n=1 Tax=Drosophila mojavensis TaxID=7230 RepID=B4KTY9_DROMO|nr:TBC1 domain family member 31 isoform X1 [Drosophila mojavensis]EDW08566.2 uncharacterized protein Dmoj_GI19504 [Drosophila mojavensis]